MAARKVCRQALVPSRRRVVKLPRPKSNTNTPINDLRSVVEHFNKGGHICQETQVRFGALVDV